MTLKNDRNYFRLLSVKELVELAHDDSELALVLAERLGEVDGAPKKPTTWADRTAQDPLRGIVPRDKK